MRSQQTPNNLSDAYFCVLLSSHSYRIINNIRAARVTHNPKVAGSNPAPATKESKALRVLRDAIKQTTREQSLRSAPFLRFGLRICTVGCSCIRHGASRDIFPRKFHRPLNFSLPNCQFGLCFFHRPPIQPVPEHSSCCTLAPRKPFWRRGNALSKLLQGTTTR